jgi:hypothetical protein
MEVYSHPVTIWTETNPYSEEYYRLVFNALLALAYTLISCSAYFSTLKMEAIFSSETFNRLHGVIPQKIVLFKTTAVRISNPTKSYSVLH